VQLDPQDLVFRDSSMAVNLEMNNFGVRRNIDNEAAVPDWVLGFGYSCFVLEESHDSIESVRAIEYLPLRVSLYKSNVWIPYHSLQ
jgi:hypothetical protein